MFLEKQDAQLALVLNAEVLATSHLLEQHGTAAHKRRDLLAAIPIALMVRVAFLGRLISRDEFLSVTIHFLGALQFLITRQLWNDHVAFLTTLSELVDIRRFVVQLWVTAITNQSRRLMHGLVLLHLAVCHWRLLLLLGLIVVHDLTLWLLHLLLLHVSIVVELLHLDLLLLRLLLLLILRLLLLLLLILRLLLLLLLILRLLLLLLLILRLLLHLLHLHLLLHLLLMLLLLLIGRSSVIVVHLSILFLIQL